MTRQVFINSVMGGTIGLTMGLNSLGVNTVGFWIIITCLVIVIINSKVEE